MTLDEFIEHAAVASFADAFYADQVEDGPVPYDRSEADWLVEAAAYVGYREFIRMIEQDKRSPLIERRRKPR